MLQLNVTKRLREFAVNIDLTLDPGITVLLGPSGHGKTTVLNMITGLVRPDAGTIRFADKVLFDANRGIDVSIEKREIGFVFQDYALFPHMSVFDNIAYGLRVRGYGSSEIHTRVSAELDRLSINELADALPVHLSAGQRQRVALARTLITHPRAILLDEPLSALDMQLRVRVRAELRSLLSRLQIPALVVSHDPLDATGLGDTVMVMEQGQIVQRGTYESLMAAPSTRFVADFVESNAFEGSLIHFDPEGDSRVSIAPGVEIHVSLDKAMERSLIVLHPWEISLSKEPIQSSIQNVLSGIVVSVCTLRDRVRVLLDVGIPLAAEISRTSAHSLELKEGKPVYAFFKTTALKAFDNKMELQACI